MNFNNVIMMISRERDRQDAKWGIQHHTHLEWLAILMEEVGEAAQAIVQEWIDNEGPRYALILKEIVQCAAVCVAWLEDKA
jgi:NTP pyrophosphatase (non-canonical NTP hydrolase)